MVQYNAALIISGAFKGTSSDKIYQKLGLECFTDSGWTVFHKTTLGWITT